MIRLTQDQVKEIEAHGTQAYPEECCGAMLGSVDYNTNAKTVNKLVRIENTSTENRHRRFAVTAEDYQALEKQAKAEGLSLLGFYHTHPDHPAQPSETDLRFAWPNFSYIIQSIRNGTPAELNSFELDLDTDQFGSEDVQVALD